MTTASRVRGILCFIVAGLSISLAEPSKEKEISYHGLIREDAKPGDVVELDRTLFVRQREKNMGQEICGYTLYKSYSELPFKVVLTDRKDGTAHIELAPGYTLNYERRHKYSFDIAAHDCTTGQHTQREKVYIEVQDVNEFVPHWKEEMYIREVEEGKIYDEILQLEAEDEDGSSDLSRICHYHLITPDVPFKIDRHGVLSNTAPLDYSKKHNYILEVKAEDCGGLMSDKIMVNIAIKESCKVGWKGITPEVDFTPGSGTELLAESATLELCDTDCEDPTIEATLALSTDQAEQQCDRDMYSVQAQRRICGASPETVDLLPNPTLGSWSKSPEDNQNTDQTFSFDGVNNAIVIQDSKFKGNFGETFTITTWINHKGTEEDRHHEGSKEHILCYSDGEYHNRHHFSVFIHNCHLVLLIRREPGKQVDLNQFRPAEWRWALPQACDGEWHHYAINVGLPQVHLYIDGHHTAETEDSPVIVDDWPLHPSKKVKNMKLVVGACYHGGDGKMAAHFRGELAGLTVVKGMMESEQVIQCLSDCQEKLDFHDMADLQAGMSVSMNSEMSQITFKGQNKTAVEKLIHHVGYKNSRVYPTPGFRRFSLTTSIQCSNNVIVGVPEAVATVKVAQPARPTMRLEGPDIVTHSETEVSLGVSVLEDLSISSNVDKTEKLENYKLAQQTLKDPSLRYQLDSCIIRAQPPLNLNKEHLTYPRNMVTSLGLEVSANEEGLIIAGADIVKHYEEVLHAIHYLHSTPETLNIRHFIVSCTELNGRFVSNDYEVQLNVIHKTHEQVNPPAAHRQESVIYQELNKISDVKISKTAPLKSASAGSLSGAGTAATGTGVGMIVIIVVCVGFLMFMIVLGVIRIRSAQQRREVPVEDKPEMEWDNSALTITVNPMDQENIYDEETEMGGLRGDDSDSDDDDISMSHDEIDTSEDEGIKEPTAKDRSDLEWDDSTLTF